MEEGVIYPVALSPVTSGGVIPHRTHPSASVGAGVSCRYPPRTPTTAASERHRCKGGALAVVAEAGADVYSCVRLFTMDAPTAVVLKSERASGGPGRLVETDR